jgi:hypothetical protein
MIIAIEITAFFACWSQHSRAIIALGFVSLGEDIDWAWRKRMSGR